MERKHWIAETEAWIHALNELQQLNIQLKNRIAEALKTSKSSDILNRIEYYQGSLLDKDAVIAFLRRDIRALQKSDFEDSNAARRYEALGADMKKMEKELSSLESELNHFVESTNG